MRTQVFDHVQRMPIDFFSRAQTADAPAPVRRAGPLGRRPPRRHHPGALPAQRRDGPDVDRALQRLGCAAREAVRPPGVRIQVVRPARGPRSRHRRSLGDVLPRRDDRARPARVAGHGHRVRRRRLDGRRGVTRDRHAGRPDRLPRTAVRTADRALERAGRRDDDARELRAGARGPRSRAVHRRTGRTDADPGRAAHRRARRRPVQVPVGCGRVARLARRRGAARPRRQR